MSSFCLQYHNKIGYLVDAIGKNVKIGTERGICMRIWTLVLATFLLILSGCSTQNGNYAVTGMGSSGGDAGASIGKVVNQNVEVGLTGIAYNFDENHDTYAVGPYAAYLLTDPLPEDVVADWRPFAGGAMLLNLDDGQGEFIPQIFGGVIYKPRDALSPVGIVEKSFPSGAINSPDIAALGESERYWFALRYRF